jgi:hypothetical protein
MCISPRDRRGKIGDLNKPPKSRTLVQVSRLFPTTFPLVPKGFEKLLQFLGF